MNKAIKDMKLYTKEKNYIKVLTMYYKYIIISI